MTFIRENVARVGKLFFHLFDVDWHYHSFGISGRMIGSRAANYQDLLRKRNL
jgi:hypothetical protein